MQHMEWRWLVPRRHLKTNRKRHEAETYETFPHNRRHSIASSLVDH